MQGHSSALKLFWQSWIREYLPTITTRKKWNTPSHNFFAGGLLIIVHKKILQSNWLLERITEIHSKNNVIRIVKLKTKLCTYTIDQQQTYVCSKNH